MPDPPADQPPPRVRVALPGDRTTPGGLLRLRQGPDGRWWAEVTVYVPAAAVHQIDGQDYTGVPREPARPAAGPGWVLTADTRPGQPRAAVLHTADCWTLGKPAAWTTITPVDDADMARAMLRLADTTACSQCSPDLTHPAAPGGP